MLPTTNNSMSAALDNIAQFRLTGMADEAIQEVLIGDGFTKDIVQKAFERLKDAQQQSLTLVPPAASKLLSERQNEVATRISELFKSGFAKDEIKCVLQDVVTPEEFDTTWKLKFASQFDEQASISLSVPGPITMDPLQRMPSGNLEHILPPTPEDMERMLADLGLKMNFEHAAGKNEKEIVKARIEAIELQVLGLKEMGMDRGMIDQLLQEDGISPDDIKEVWKTKFPN